jgi:DNA-binding winged helix-turn-helix (wHTH) protein/Cdc6-like AAA superfamily ATPase
MIVPRSASEHEDRAPFRDILAPAIVYRFGDCELDEELFELRRGGERIAVQPKVLKLLILLVRERARALERGELLRAVWSDVKVANDSVARAVVEARRAIGDEKHTMIITVRGRGFRFAAPVTEEMRAAAGIGRSLGFVGRDGHLAALRACLDDALAGHARFAAIAGDAGVGKTCLAAELAAVARATQAHVFVARTHESPTPPPLRTWIQLVQALVDRFGEPVADVAHRALSLLGEGGNDFATFEAVARVFQRAAAVGPVVVVADDLHWADERSLRLLGFVAREVREAHLLVVWTYRDAAIADDVRARALGAALRESGSVPIHLGGLSLDETARLVFELKGQEPSPRLVAALYERTGGSPLFIREVLETEWAARALANELRSLASSIDLQNGVRASVERHLEGISPECRNVLVCAAVLGRDLDFAPLGALTGLDSKTLLDCLDEAVRARLVAKGTGGRYAFVLPLVGDVLYKQLGAGERAAWHREAARVLEGLHREARDVHAARIAHHFFRAAPAGVAREAFAYSVRAAQHAEASGDARAAVKLWKQALRSLELVPASGPARLESELALANAHSRAGDDKAACEAYLEAAMLARALGRPEGLAQAALAYARVAPSDDPRRGALLAEARDVAHDTQGLSAPGLLDRLTRDASD